MIRDCENTCHWTQSHVTQMLRMTIAKLHHPKKEALAQNYSTPGKELMLILTLELHGDCSSRATRTVTTILLPATALPCIRVAAP